MPEPKLEPHKPGRIVRTLLGGTVGYVAGGFVGLVFGRLLSSSQIQLFLVLDMVKAYAIGVALGTLLGAAIGMLTGRKSRVPRT